MKGIVRQCTAKRSCGRRCQEAIEKGGQHSCGERCRKPAIRGGTVCASHGGASPQVKRSARQTLLDGADPVAMKLVEQALAEGPPCATCGRGTTDGAVLVRARTAVLDRAGVGPHSTVSVEASASPGWVQFLTDEQVATVGAWISEAKARMNAGAEPERGSTVTVVDPESPAGKFQRAVQEKKARDEARLQGAEVQDAVVVSPVPVSRPVLALVRQFPRANGTPLPEDGSDER